MDGASAREDMGSGQDQPEDSERDSLHWMWIHVSEDDFIPKVADPGRALVAYCALSA
jgi:hypothetical protein